MRRCVYGFIVATFFWVTPFFTSNAMANPRSLSPELIAIAIDALSWAQALTLQDGIEYCGSISIDAEGSYHVTLPFPGDEGHCSPPSVPPSLTVIASYHTHGTVGEPGKGGAFEFPSRHDLETTDWSFISTPGGRLWLIDPFIDELRLLGRPGYFEQDPGFAPFKKCNAIASYPIKEVVKRYRNFAFCN